MPRKMLIIDVAALSPADVGERTPNLNALARSGSMRPVREPFPSLTCTSHATLLTGSLPRDHGMIGNCLYSREYAKLFNWTRSSHLIAGEPLWEAARKRHPALRVANLFFRNCADSSCDIRVIERPVYWASGRKQPEFYTEPHSLHAELVQHLGPFPFARFWGPGSNIASSSWILGAASYVMAQSDPELLLVYPPFLDYDAARFGPDSREFSEALTVMDAALRPLLEAARASDRDVLIVSDYGFTAVDQPVFLNRSLRRAGFLRVEVARNGECLDYGTSRAFAVCDNQVAHIYIAQRDDIPSVRSLLEETTGVGCVLDAAAQSELGIDHPRSGELIATASERAWFAYPYWLDEARAPDFAECMAVFDKAGTDTSELFLKPGVFGGLHLMKRIAQTKLGFKVPLDVIDTNAARVGGARRIARDDPQHGAAVLASWRLTEADPMAMQDLKDVILSRMFETV